MSNIISSEQIFDGVAFGVEKRVIKHPVTGAEINRDIVTHAPVVVCVIEDEETHELYITEEYRAGVDRVTKGLVAGFVDKGESFFRAAEREVKEESGFDVYGFRSLIPCSVNSSEGFTDEEAYLFHILVRKDLAGDTNFDEDEFIQGKFYSQEEVLKMMKNGTISSAQCLTALMSYFLFFPEKKNLDY